MGEKLTLNAETSYSSFLIQHFDAVEMISKKHSIQTLCKVGTISPPQIAPVVIALPRETDRGGPFLSSRRQIIQNIFILYLFLLWESREPVVLCIYAHREANSNQCWQKNS